MWFQYPGTIDEEDNEKLFDGFDGTTSDDQPDNVARHPNGTKNIINNEKTISNNSNTPSHLETAVIVKKQNVIDFSRNLTNLNRESNDLLQRLLEKNPQYRLKSLLALKRIAIFKNFNFKDVEERKVNSIILKLVSNIIAVCVSPWFFVDRWLMILNANGLVLINVPCFASFMINVIAIFQAFLRISLWILYLNIMQFVFRLIWERGNEHMVLTF